MFSTTEPHYWPQLAIFFKLICKFYTIFLLSFPLLLIVSIGACRWLFTYPHAFKLNGASWGSTFGCCTHIHSQTLGYKFTLWLRSPKATTSGSAHQRWFTVSWRVRGQSRWNHLRPLKIHSEILLSASYLQGSLSTTKLLHGLPSVYNFT